MGEVDKSAAMDAIANVGHHLGQASTLIKSVPLKTCLPGDSFLVPDCSALADLRAWLDRDHRVFL